MFSDSLIGWNRISLKLNRIETKQPWIIAYAHRPMYCSNDIDDTPTICTADTSALRDGVNWHGGHRVGALEPLFYHYNVDMYFSGHMHSYERLYQTYHEQVLSHNYDPLIAPVHIIAGAAGGPEALDVYDYGYYPWSAVRSYSYGYGKLLVYNATHAHWQQILDEDGSILDQVWLVKGAAPHNTHVEHELHSQTVQKSADNKRAHRHS